MSQEMALQSSSVVWAENNGYEQVWQSLKCADRAAQPQQCHTLTTGSKTGSIIQRVKLCQLPRLPQLLHIFLAIICTSTHHTAGKKVLKNILVLQ